VGPNPIFIRRRAALEVASGANEPERATHSKATAFAPLFRFTFRLTRVFLRVDWRAQTLRMEPKSTRIDLKLIEYELHNHVDVLLLHNTFIFYIWIENIGCVGVLTNLKRYTSNGGRFNCTPSLFL